VGTAPGARDVYDSGSMVAVGRRHRFAPSLQANTTYYASIYTNLGDNWLSSPITFTTGPDTGVDFSSASEATVALVDKVRAMADDDCVPYAGTRLDDIVKQYGGQVASCGNFAVALLEELGAARVRGARSIQVAFNDNGYDGHELVQIYASAQGQWALLDPTFDLVPYRVSDGQFATAADLQNSTLTATWGAIRYRFLGTEGSAYANGYYLDYPLLYLNLLASTAPPVDIMPYLSPVGASVNAWGNYVVRGTANATATLLVDGTAVSLPVQGPNDASKFFMGTDVAVVSQLGTLYQARRYVF
jgi:hypothetical protein